MAMFGALQNVSFSHLLVAVVAYSIYGAVYRLYLSPISAFPGPKFAALTLWYEFFYDNVLRGRYIFKVMDLHRQYGPIVRISPYELHVSTPEFCDTLYASTASGEKRNKYAWFTKAFGMDNSVFATPDHDTHRMRRAALNPFFSMQSVRRLQPVIQERVDMLMIRIREFQRGEEVLMASWMFAAFTNDVVMQYSFARSDRRLEAPDFDPSYRNASFFGSTMSNFLKHAPWINFVMQSVPDSMARLIHPAMASFIAQKRNTFKQIIAIQSGMNQAHKDISHPTIFHSILSSKLPPAERSVARLSDDAQVLMMAGTLTTAWTLEVCTFHLLQPQNAHILRRLKNELYSAIPNTDKAHEVQLPVLEALPYLNAVIKEGLRLTYGVSGRLQRISPDAPIPFNDGNKDWLIPPGTPVSMTSVQIHHDETLFPDSREFKPERWLDDDNAKLDKYLLSFTKGSRQCLGMYLAFAEMYLCLSAIWRRWGSIDVRLDGDEGVLELYETTLKDVEIQGDNFLPLVQKGSKGIRMKVLQ